MKLKQLYELFRSFAVAVGLLLMFGAASSSDYYTELRQPDPESVSTMAVWGLLLTVPYVLHLLREYLKDRRDAK